MHLIYNNDFVETNHPVLNASNRSFRYGDALFETIKVVNGRPQFLDRHLTRLYRGMNVLGMNLPTLLHLHPVDSMVQDLLRINEITEGGRIRLTVFRKDGGAYLPETDDVDMLIEAFPAENNYPLNDEGLKIGLYQDLRKPINTLGFVKSANSLLFVLAAKFAQKSNFHDVVLLNENGNICEATASNIFLVKKNTLYTPNMEEGYIPGIMRERIIYMANTSGYQVEEGALTPQMMHVADEVFLTNSIKGIQWVKAFENKRYFNKVAKALSHALNA